MKKRPLVIFCLVSLFLQLIRVLCVSEYADELSAVEKAAECSDQTVVTGEVCEIEEKETSMAVVLKNCAVSFYPDGKDIRVLVYLKVEKGKQKIRHGNIIEVSGTPKIFEQAANPGNFDQRNYYKKQKIEFMIFADHMVIRSKNINASADFLYGFKSRWKQILTDNLGEYYGGIMSAVLLGDKNSLDREVQKLYRKCGIGHILAVSGLHMSFLGMGIYRLLRRIGAGFIISGSSGIIVLLLYLFMIGPGVSSSRAFLMFLIHMGADMTGRDYDLPTSLFLSALILCLIQPLYILDAAFLLSFGAILGMFFLSPVICGCLRTDCVKWRPVKRTLENMGTSLAVTIFLMGPVLYFYYEIPLYSVCLNMAVIPLLPAVMVAGTAGSALYTLWPAAGRAILKICRQILNLYDEVCTFAGNLPFSRIVTGKPSLLLIMIYYFILSVICILYFIAKNTDEESYICFNTEKRRKILLQMKRCAGGFMIVAAAGMVFVCRAVYKTEENLIVTVLDVGQGDSVHISAGNINCLVDGGSTTVEESGLYRIEPYLLSSAVDSLEYVIATHGDEDHISGIRDLLENQKFGVKIKNLIVPKPELWDRNLAGLTEIAESAGTRVISAEPGSRLSFGEGRDNSTLICIAPDSAVISEPGNEASLVFILEYRGFRMLLPGDLEGKAEEQLINSGDLRECDVLKVAHHGSQNSSSEKFLELVCPKIAIISCGKNNMYGHPHKETLEKLESTHCSIYNTASDGTVRIITDGDQIQILHLSK